MLLKKTHRRLNPLTNEWVLVCANRTNRPWQGAEETPAQESAAEHDPNCYLCPGNTRVNGDENPTYSDVFVFANDFSALTPELELSQILDPLFTAEEVAGECRVICFSPQHNLTLADMSVPAIENVVSVWQEQHAELSELYRWVQIFENKGEVMGCSNPHPHGQVWASSHIPNNIRKTHNNLEYYHMEQGKNLLLDYMHAELELKDRIVEENDDWLVVVPYWATWPFETLLLPKQHIPNWRYVSPAHKLSLAQILQSTLQRYDRLFNVSFPYSMGWHCAPNTAEAEKYWQLHAHFYPPLLRSAGVKKFMVGYEMLAETQRDFTPEFAAQKLREA
jgi:UDPglucose--hexose-1-phosphate uridylyltransferase